MEIRRSKIKRHKIIIGCLTALFGITFLTLIGTLMASEIVATAPSKIPAHSWYENFDNIEPMILENFDESYAEIDDSFERTIEHKVGTIYLTFDDGPSEYTNALLDTLKKYNVKATFFVTGRGDDAVILREFNEGHAVALHTFSHNYSLIYSSVENYFADLSQISERVKRITGEDAKVIRFPGGSSNTVSAKYDGPIRIMSILANEVSKRGFVYFDWNVDSNDAGNINSSDIVYSNVVSHLKEGTNVVLQHDTKNFSIEAVGRIIEYGLNNGYDFRVLDINSPPIRHGINN